MSNSLSSTDVAALEMLSQQTIQLAAHYQRNAEDAGIVRQFLAARWKLAESLERLPDAELERSYRGSFGKAYQAVIATDLRTEKYESAGPVGESEQSLLGLLETALTKGWGEPRALQHFLALSLYR